MLLPGVKVTLNIERARRRRAQTWTYPEGLKGYLAELSDGAEPVAPIFDGEKYLGAPKDGDTFAEGEGAAWAFAWSTKDAATARATST